MSLAEKVKARNKARKEIAFLSDQIMIFEKEVNKLTEQHRKEQRTMLDKIRINKHQIRILQLTHDIEDSVDGGGDWDD